MKCPRCGTENPAGKIVCRNCGMRLRAPGGQTIVRQSEGELMAWVRSDVRRLLVVSAIVIAAGLVLGSLVR